MLSFDPAPVPTVNITTFCYFNIFADIELWPI